VKRYATKRNDCVARLAVCVRKNYSVILFWSFWGILVQILAILYSVLFWYSGGVGGVGGGVGMGVLCFFFAAMQPETPKRARDEAIIIDDATPTQRARSEEDVAMTGFVRLGDFWYCQKCFDDKGAPLKPTVSGGKRGEGLVGRFSSSSSPFARRKHYSTHASDISVSLLSQATAAEHLFSNSRGELWAWAVVDCNLPFSIARPSLCEALRASIPPEFRALARFSVPEAAEIKAEITSLATKLRQIVRLKYQGSPCLLALDGGTLHRTTLLNFMLLSVRPNSTPLFVVSRQVRDLTAATIKKTISEVASLVREVFGMIPVGIVSDNASAMARAIEDYDEDDDDDVAGAAMFTEDPPANEDEAEEEEGEANFFVHVRCWSHVFQLLIGDVAKQLPTAVEVLRKVLHISRSTRDHVARLRIIAGKSTTKLVIPTATRWNSQTRSAARILDFVCELQEAGVGLTVDEIVALKVFVICTAPFAWATTKAQSDHATIGTVRHLCSEIRDEFNAIKNQAQEFPESTRNMVLRVCAAAEAALLTREARYLTNTVTDALDTLESVNTLAASKWTALQKLVGSYYRTINVTRDVEPEISLFRFRSDDERFRSNEESYWNSIQVKETYGLLQKFRSEMRGFLSTEACVERSFQRRCSKPVYIGYRYRFGIYRFYIGYRIGK
jgi:hypothetical protein